MRNRVLPFALLVMAVFSVQSVFADYCTSADTKSSASKYLTSFSLTDGKNSMFVTGLQTATADTEPCYFDKTDNVLATTPGSLITPNVDYVGTSSFGSIWVDWNKDDKFTASLASDGVPKEESDLVSYTFNQLPGQIGQNSNGEQFSKATHGSSWSVHQPEELNDAPFVIPLSVKPGEYRARLLITGGTSITGSSATCPPKGILGMYQGAIVDFTILVSENLIPERTVTLEVNPVAAGTVSGGGKGEGAIVCRATANEGYIFANWTDKASGEVVSTTVTYYYNNEGDKTLIANFRKDPKLVRLGWTATADSEANSGADGPAGYAIDNDNKTWWHSQYAPTVTEYPHWIIFDLGKSESFTSFNYVSRSGMTNDTGNGNIASYKLYVSENEADVKGYLESAMVQSGNFSYSGLSAAQDHMVRLEAPVTGRYVLLKAETSANSKNFAGCAEFYLYIDAFVVKVESADPTIGDVYIDTKGNKTKEVGIDGNETVILTAEPVEGYHFVSWTLNGSVVSTDAFYTTDFVTEGRNYVANFAFTNVEPRLITVLSSDDSKGKVSITYPATTDSSITTGDFVTVEATPVTGDDFFVNWTDGNGNVLSESASYKYDKASAITLKANFVTRYIVIINQTAGGSLTVKSSNISVSSGDRLEAGAILAITVKTDPGKGLNSLLINGTEIYVEDQEAYTVEVTAETNIKPSYGEGIYRLEYEYSGAGYIEIWSSDSSFGDGENKDKIPVEPAGIQYRMGDIIPYGKNIYIFVCTYGGGYLESITVNGDERKDDEYFNDYGDIEHSVASHISVTAKFSGTGSGIEDSKAAGVKVHGVSGGIVIDSELAVTAEIFTAGGELVATPSVSSNSTVSIASGFYIVRVNGAAYKVSVK